MVRPATQPATRASNSRASASLVGRGCAAWAFSAACWRVPRRGRPGASRVPPRLAPTYSRKRRGSANPRLPPIGSGTHSARTTQTWPKLQNGLRADESSGSWCIVARLIPLPVLRASVSSIRTYSGCAAGIQASASRNTTRPTASRLQVARVKNRWNTEMWRCPTPPDASATAVIVRRPRQWIQPASTNRKTRNVGARKHGSNAASRSTNAFGTMIPGMAPSLVRDTSRVHEGAMFRQPITALPPKWRKSSLDADVVPEPLHRLGHLVVAGPAPADVADGRLEAVGVAGLGQELLRPGRVVRQRLEVEGAEQAGDRRRAQRQRR